VGAPEAAAGAVAEAGAVGAAPAMWPLGQIMEVFVFCQDFYHLTKTPKVRPPLRFRSLPPAGPGSQAPSTAPARIHAPELPCFPWSAWSAAQLDSRPLASLPPWSTECGPNWIHAPSSRHPGPHGVVGRAGFIASAALRSWSPWSASVFQGMGGDRAGLWRSLKGASMLSSTRMMLLAKRAVARAAHPPILYLVTDDA